LRSQLQLPAPRGNLFDGAGNTGEGEREFFVDDLEIDPSVVKLIPFETAKRYQILPLSRVGASLTIAMVDPTNVFAMDDIKFMTGFNIEPVVASESSIQEGIEKAYGGSNQEDLLRGISGVVGVPEHAGAGLEDRAQVGLIQLGQPRAPLGVQTLNTSSPPQ